MAPVQSVTDIRFGMNVDEDIEANSELTLNFPVQLSGAGLDGGELDLSLDDRVDVVVDTTPVDAVPLETTPESEIEAPTSLSESEEPLERKLFLPLISR